MLPRATIAVLLQPLKTPAGRQTFLRVLNTQRCIATELTWGLPQLAAACCTCLDHCAASGDVDSALKLMLMVSRGSFFF